MQEIIIATIMRPTGETGVQTHFNCFRDYLCDKQISNQLVTPFSYYKTIVYPVFAVRKILNKVSGEISVWWYRHWHAFFLRQALKQRLQTGMECVIYAQCPVAAEAALSARATQKQRVILVVHFNISQADEWVGKSLISNGGVLYNSIQRFEENVLPKLDGLVFVSRFMQQELTKRIPAIAKVPSVVVPNFLPDPGLPQDQHPNADLISIGTLEARKNQNYILQIVAALREQGKPLKLTIVGDGPDRHMLENKAQALKIDHLVRFAGFINNAAEQIGLHKAVIHVATIENLPVTLIEAMARGKPVFAAPVGGIPEMLGDGIVGLALPLNDAHTAAQIVANAMSNQEWMITAGLSARARFLKEYSSDVAAKCLIDFFKGVNDTD